MKRILFLLLIPFAAFGQLQLPYSVQIVNPRPVDFLYYEADGTPWDNTTEVTTTIIAAIRYRGLTVNISGVEYWFRDGTTNGDLVVKLTSATAGNGMTLNGSAFDWGGTLLDVTSIDQNGNDLSFVNGYFDVSNSTGFNVNLLGSGTRIDIRTQGLIEIIGGNSVEIGTINPAGTLLMGSNGRTTIAASEIIISGANEGVSINPDFASGILKIFNLPTSSAGLVSGQVWVDTGAGNVLKIVP
jgi:hypothetical protein